MNWTPAQAKEYMAKRLRDEERTRTKIYANHNPSQGIRPAIPEQSSGQTLVGVTPRKAKSGNQPPSRFKITFIVRSRKPCDYDNICIKYIQDSIIDCLQEDHVAQFGKPLSDKWDVLQGTVISEKADSAEDEGTLIVIEQI